MIRFRLINVQLFDILKGIQYIYNNNFIDRKVDRVYEKNRRIRKKYT